MEFPKIKNNPTKKFAVGLRDATASEIDQYLATLRSYGVRARQVTHKKNGDKLPFNGIIQVNY